MDQLLHAMEAHRIRGAEILGAMCSIEHGRLKTALAMITVFMLTKYQSTSP